MDVIHHPTINESESTRSKTYLNLIYCSSETLMLRYWAQRRHSNQSMDSLVQKFQQLSCQFEHCVNTCEWCDETIFINYIAPLIHEFVSECQNYTDLVKILEDIYSIHIRPGSEVFSRQILSTNSETTSWGKPRPIHKLFENSY